MLRTTIPRALSTFLSVKILTSYQAESGALPFTKVKLNIHFGLDQCSRKLARRRKSRLDQICMLCLHPRLTPWA